LYDVEDEHKLFFAELKKLYLYSAKRILSAASLEISEAGY
jgi:hypothetical protein